MNGRVIPVSGMSLRLPAAMMKAWTPTTRARPVASSARKSSAADAAIRRPALDDHEVDPEDRESPRSARAPRRGRPAGSRCGSPGSAAARRRPAGPRRARSRGARRGRTRSGPGRPGSRPPTGRRTGRARRRPGSGRGRTAGRPRSRRSTRRTSPTIDVAGARRGDVDEREEHGEEEEGGAEVALDDDDPERDRPHRRASAGGTAAAAAGADRAGCSPRRAAAGTPTGSRPGTRPG